MMTAGAPAVALGRCNPYGAETGGPKRVLGGLYGAASARTPGMHLPQNVEEGEWACGQPAVVRCRMTCRCGHKGQVMQLCSWRNDTVHHSEWVAGTLRQVSETVRQHGHYEEIQRRQAGLCPACAYPPPYGELAKEVQAWQAQLTGLYYRGQFYSQAARVLKTRVEDAGKLMDMARQAGIIHQCPLTLVPVS